MDDTLQIGVVKAERDETTAPTVVASVQTLARPQRLERLTADFSTVVVDEAHHAPAETYMRILDHCDAWDDQGPLVLGVTATPERADKQSLADVFEDIVYQKSILEMMQAGFLCDLRAIQVLLQREFRCPAYPAWGFCRKRISRRAHARQCASTGPRGLSDAREQIGKALCFTPTVATAYAIAEAFQDAGIAAEALDGTTPMDERRDILQRLHTGETQVVCNCAVLTEGFDEPSIDCIIMARPTQSRPFYQQMIGRGTRIYPGKQDCLILDVVGVSTKHRLQTVATLFELNPVLLTEESVLEAVETQERRRHEAIVAHR